MKTSIQQSNQARSAWLKKPIASLNYRHWLVSRHSLTQRLKSHCADFVVETVNIHYQKPLPDEVSLLKLRVQQMALIRDVKLTGHAQAVVYAHSVLPRKSLRGVWYRLSHLGNQPLGAALFSNFKVRRQPLHYKKLTKQHALYQLATRTLQSRPDYLWARRSVFQLNCANILVTEVFLPSILML